MTYPNKCGVCYTVLDDNSDCPVCDADVPALIANVEKLDCEVKRWRTWFSNMPTRGADDEWLAEGWNIMDGGAK